MERVRRKLARLMLVAGLTLGLGLFAVFGAILYRIAVLDDKAPDEAGAPAGIAGEALVDVEMPGAPAGARLVAIAPDGPRVVLAYERDGATILVTLDRASGRIVGRVTLTPE